MKRFKFFSSLMFALLFAAFVGTAFGAPAGAAALGLSFLPRPTAGVLKVGITPDIWVNYIVENIFKNNEFLLQSVDESQYVLCGGVVHIPQAGAPSGVKRNRTSLPATISRRSDTDVTYALDEFTTDPRFIPEADKVELAYDKLNSCMSEDMSYLTQVIADTMLWNWRPKWYIKATATKSANYLIHGTGLRTGVCTADFAKAKEVFDKWGIPKQGRRVILNTEMYNQICADVRLSTLDNLNAVYDHVNGRLAKLEGFEIEERATVLLASNSTLSAESGTAYYKFTSTDLNYTPEEYEDIVLGDASAANTACAIGLFWHPNFVRRAIGDTKMFNKDGDPTYYGDIYSFLQRAGGRLGRGDGRGVLGIIQEYHAS